MEKEGEKSKKGDAPYTGKSTPTGKEEASTPQKRKIEEKLNRRAKKESGGVL